MTDDRPTFGSLFAGIGGIDLGLERAGWRGRWQVEWDDWCRDRLADRWPDIRRYGDITDIDFGTVEPVDLLAGGFPCQPLSAAGLQAAQEDARWLWPEFHRAIRALRPRLILVENVTNLLAVNDGSALGDILGDLASSGYDTEWDCIPAAAVGAPHERDRFWLVAYPQGDGRSVGGSGDFGRDDLETGGKWLRTEPRRDGAGSRASAVADAGRIGSERRGVAGVVRRSADATQGEAPQRERRGDTAGDRGQALADTDSRRWGPGQRDDDAGQPDTPGGGASLADTTGNGREPRRPGDAPQEPGGWEPRRGDSGRSLAGRVFHPELGAGWFAGSVAHPPGQRQPGSGQPVHAVHPATSADGQATEPLDGRLSDKWRPEPGLGGAADGLFSGLDHCWPAPPGPQHDWEPPRTVTGRVPDRTRRLKACGNAAVPQVVEVIGWWLLEAEALT